jgi:hypothetical protein
MAGVKLLIPTLAAVPFAATAGAAFAGGDAGCALETKKQITAETLRPKRQATTAGS